jgi:hypothetical protein
MVVSLKSVYGRWSSNAQDRSSKQSVVEVTASEKNKILTEQSRRHGFPSHLFSNQRFRTNLFKSSRGNVWISILQMVVVS